MMLLNSNHILNTILNTLLPTYLNCAIIIRRLAYLLALSILFVKNAAASQLRLKFVSRKIALK